MKLSERMKRSKPATRHESGKGPGLRADPAPEKSHAPMIEAEVLAAEDGNWQEQWRAGSLALIATPIGNLGDISLRALAWLRIADIVVCEDKRITTRLLDRFGIKKPLVTYHEHNAARMRPRILAWLQGGSRIALLSDAGTPLVSDPGYKLVRAVVEADLPVIALPGPSAALTALVVSGLPSNCFLFSGFLPPRQGQRQQMIRKLAQVPATLIFYEAPQRMAETLADLADCLGDRPAAVARELTKKFETIERGTLSALALRYNAAAPKGEFVILVAPPAAIDATKTADDLDAALAEALARMSVKDAVASVAHVFSMPRAAVYRRALDIAGK